MPSTAATALLVVSGVAAVGGAIYLLNRKPAALPGVRATLLVKAYDIGFDLVDGEEIDAPRAFGMLHDPSGKRWPSHSLLVTSYRKLGRAVSNDEYDGDAEEYFGRTYNACRGAVQLPPRSLSDWTRVGEVERIWYTRPGTRAPGRYKHAFNRPRGLYRIPWLVSRALHGRGRAVLYERGRAMRLELPRWAIVDARGLVLP